MPRGDKFTTRITTFTDPKTDRSIRKMTSWDGAHCIATYMYSQALSRDERFLFFASDRTGLLQLYRLDTASGETVQVTDVPPEPRTDISGIIAWCSVHPDLQELFYCTGQGIFAVNVATLEERLVTRPEPGRVLFAFPMASFMADGRHAIVTCRLADGHPAVCLADVRGGPLEVVHRWPDPKGALDNLLGGRRGDRLVITFAPSPDLQNKRDLPPEQRARSWQLDPATGKAEPFLVMPPGFRATHETWAPPRKDRLFHHKKTVPQWTPASVESIAGDGTDRRVHFVSPDRKLGHSCVSPDGAYLACDVQDPAGNELYLVDLRTGKSQILCWPNSSVADGTSGHVHPSFSPTGRSVVYTSDAAGKAAVFMVDIVQPP